MVLAEPLLVTLVVVDALKAISVRYLVGGSLASSMHGIPRATHDVDLVVEMGPEHVAPLVAALQGAFYIDRDTIDEALKRRSSFNIIHLETMLKVDIFIAGSGAFAREELARAEARQIEDGELVVATAEDIVIEKLRWYRLGDGVSDRQWRDVLGVLQVKNEDLDWEYMRRWSRSLGLEELLERAAAEASPEADEQER